MKYGIEAVYNKQTQWCTNGGVRMEFDSMEDAKKELADWRKNAWTPRRAKYTTKEISE